MKDQISGVIQEYTAKIQNAQTLKELDDIFIALFGKNGVITLLPKEFAKLSKTELQELGPLFNKSKTDLEKAVNDKRNQIRETSYAKLDNETFNLDKKVEIKSRTGYLNPLTTFELEIISLFGKLGFQLFDAPQIDTDYYNFEVLNIPDSHPARDLWDTLYVDKHNLKTKEDLILRTHTSNGQVRIMKQDKLPIRKMLLDRCFRYENLDARHEHTFDQFELVYVDKGLSLANLLWLSEYFFKTVFGTDTKVRLKPKYYPFVEPGAGVDAECPFCKGQGCRVCGSGWLELAGAGMIHPTVLKNGGIDPDEYSGIAWGVGPERMLLTKLGIPDIRLFRNGSLKFLEEYAS